MLFNSLTFIFGFLPFLLFFYFIFYKSIKIQNIILLLFSIIFYSWGEPKYIFLMFLIVFIVYIFGLLIDKFKNKFLKKLFLICCIFILIINLIFFKYFNFIIDNINMIFNRDFGDLSIVMPIGISFYTFQILSYIIDVYKNNVRVQRNFFMLLLYVSFFPQLIAGPIVRYETIENELKTRKLYLIDIVDGLKRFIIGLSKKVIISNNLAIFVDLVFDSYNKYFGTSVIWLAIISYSLQIYFDFSGYSDMAIGLGRIFGFHFLENFNYPYISKSITEFWRKWHISLSSWFRDYIYIPLGGNKVNKIKWLRNLLIVWSLTGLWHGASWNFLLWGLYFGLLLIIEKLFLNKLLLKLPNFLQYLYSFILIIIGWIIFRVDNLCEIKFFLEKMFIYKESDWIYILSNFIPYIINLIYILPGILFCFPIYKKVYNKYYSLKLYNIINNILLILLLIICIIFITSSSYNPFIYFRF